MAKLSIAIISLSLACISYGQSLSAPDQNTSAPGKGDCSDTVNDAFDASKRQYTQSLQMLNADLAHHDAEKLIKTYHACQRFNDVNLKNSTSMSIQTDLTDGVKQNFKTDTEAQAQCYHALEMRIGAGSPNYKDLCVFQYSDTLKLIFGGNGGRNTSSEQSFKNCQIDITKVFQAEKDLTEAKNKLKDAIKDCDEEAKANRGNSGQQAPPQRKD